MQPCVSIHGCSSGGTAWLVSCPPIQSVGSLMHDVEPAAGRGDRRRDAAEPAADDQDVGAALDQSRALRARAAAVGREVDHEREDHDEPVEALDGACPESHVKA